jgi:hypothetical protein
MPRDYPIYYEDAAHMVRILVDNGLRLDNGIPTHFWLLGAARELENYAASNASHAEAGARLVYVLGTEPVNDPRLRRLNAIAGTLVGNFLLTCKRPAPLPKSEKLGEPGVAPRNPSASEKPKVRDWARWG